MTAADPRQSIPVEERVADALADLADCLITELAARGLRRPLATPMRRRREAYPRSGFGQRWPGDG